jgi:hypothetical protein
MHKAFQDAQLSFGWKSRKFLFDYAESRCFHFPTLSLSADLSELIFKLRAENKWNNQLSPGYSKA